MLLEARLVLGPQPHRARSIAAQVLRSTTLPLGQGHRDVDHDGQLPPVPGYARDGPGGDDSVLASSPEDLLVNL
eukprot:9153688-Heterocapsa_arctica.AAC.1